ncbi:MULTISPECIES: sugar ABC transporter permease [Streptococcus]|uniref:Sugar ABC transporter permease n=1 Tax=Streptococcus suis TaxID=1307 RepID=A0A0Z8D3K1_STRSU|nr:ABC transporter permease subunit [Streptococcus suis]MBM0194652.1 ABC transporter permease subunit [Streptococcus suis]MBM7152659.1 ABC transporter permease subunit [Streptococcus suis]MBM7179075.1 ABC transporter permease subunit [Streptococcus suis]MBM7316445.1 ABC transporter permease subunit [Streptococcus suis]MBM7320725.1 ABC transporter permease subunit [Streptococcus suis]
MRKWSHFLQSTGIYCILILVSFIFLFPCIWLILASFSQSGTIYSFDGFFPTSYSLKSFITLFTDTDLYNYPRWFLNTLFIASMSCILGTFLVILTAYAMSRFYFNGKNALMKTTMVLGMFPSFMGMIAVYLLMTQFNLINQLWGLVLIYSAAAPMGYLTQKGFFDTISYSIDEAARMDGATSFQIFWHIHLPLSRPIITYTALTNFAWPWSDFILPKLLLKEKNLYTVAVGLMNLDETEFARFAAGSIFIAVPIVVLYFLLIKNMVNGLTAGAVK